MPAADLVPGDTVILTAGDRGPADGRVLESVRPQGLESEPAAVDGGRTGCIA